MRNVTRLTWLMNIRKSTSFISSVWVIDISVNRCIFIQNVFEVQHVRSTFQIHECDAITIDDFHSHLNRDAYYWWLQSFRNESTLLIWLLKTTASPFHCSFHHNAFDYQRIASIKMRCFLWFCGIAVLFSFAFLDGGRPMVRLKLLYFLFEIAMWPAAVLKISIRIRRWFCLSIVTIFISRWFLSIFFPTIGDRIFPMWIRFSLFLFGCLQ